MKRKIFIIAVFIISAALLSAPAFAWPGFGGNKSGSDFEKKVEAIDKKLGLTPEQDKLLKEARSAHRKDMEDTRKLMHEKREALREALSKPGATGESVNNAVSELKKVECEMVDKMVADVLKVKSILTPEQFQKLEKIMKESKNKHHGSKCLPPE